MCTHCVIMDYIVTSCGTSTANTSTPPSICDLDGMLPRRINSAHLDIMGSMPIVATATTVSPLQ